MKSRNLQEDAALRKKLAQIDHIEAAREYLQGIKCLEEGGPLPHDGYEPDVKNAIKHFLAAAKRGYLPAQAKLAGMVAGGRDARRDLAEALKFYRLAIAENPAAAAKACLALDEMYEEGQGVVRDSVEAYKWFCLARLGDGRWRLSRRLTPEQMAEGERRAQAGQAEWTKGNASNNQTQRH